MTRTKCYIKFYADNQALGIRNKLHTYRVNDLSDARNAVLRFARLGYRIRAAWYVENQNNIRIH